VRNSAFEATALAVLALLLVAGAQGLSLHPRAADEHVISKAVPFDSSPLGLDIHDSVLSGPWDAGAHVISPSGFVPHPESLQRRVIWTSPTPPIRPPPQT
jgi:hypothetical protein